MQTKDMTRGGGCRRSMQTRDTMVQEASHKNPPPTEAGGHAPPPDGNKWATRRFVDSDESKKRLITRPHGTASPRTPSSVATRKKAKPICTGRPVLSGDTHTSVYCFCFSSFIYLPLANGTTSPRKASGASKACQQLVKHVSS
jgi:hypothetical protein